MDALKTAMRVVCGAKLEELVDVMGHSLRVGGSNHIRKLGIDDEIHRKLGGWASLSSSRSYPVVDMC